MDHIAAPPSSRSTSRNRKLLITRLAPRHLHLLCLKPIVDTASVMM